jgi:hypothetical protein
MESTSILKLRGFSSLLSAQHSLVGKPEIFFSNPKLFMGFSICFGSARFDLKARDESKSNSCKCLHIACRTCVGCSFVKSLTFGW